MARFEAKRRTGGKGRGRGKDDPAQKARERMARRARRAKFIKENKKRITYILLGFVGFIYIALFTSVGPNYYYNKLQAKKWSIESKELASGYFEGVTKLAQFYSATFRKEKARECYNEIGQLALGFSFDTYVSDPTATLERYEDTLELQRKGIHNGPPVVVPDSDMHYVGGALLAIADTLAAEGRRNFAGRLYGNLFPYLVERTPNIATDKDKKYAENTAMRVK